MSILKSSITCKGSELKKRNGKNYGAVKAKVPDASKPKQSKRWPVVYKHILALRSDPNTPPIKAVCCVLGEELNVAGLPKPKDEDPEKPTYGLVNPCGHLICNECQHVAILNGYQDCTFCSRRLNCRKCGIAPQSRLLQTWKRDIDSLKAIPKTIPEGGYFEPLCNDCGRRDPSGKKYQWMGAYDPKISWRGDDADWETRSRI
ncbi:hypothetical protein QQZ08_001218 [Neonectria magnoliae]|uniref:RING-type domain-containing protein n=1 Tax=Neonectria magnoliae TaxID=2732573 RepID=A0ABR1IHC7_9HYPO